MEEETNVVHIKAESCSLKPTGLPINWSLIAQPVLPTTPMGAALPPPQSSSGHSLKNKVKSFTQRRMRARDREKDRDRLEVEVLVSSPVTQASPDLTPQRQRPIGKSLPSSSWRTHAVKNLYSSDEEDEVEVEVKLEIHSPPAEAKVEQELQETMDNEIKDAEIKEETQAEAAEDNQKTSRDRLQSDTSSSSKDEQPNPPAAPSSTTSASSTTTTSVSTTTARHWAPPKGFWRVARPETLLLNGVSLQSMPTKDLTQIEEQREPQTKTGTADTETAGADGELSDDCESSSRIKHSDSLEGYLDKKKESDMIRPGKSEELASDADSAEEKLTVKQRMYTKLRERQQICRELREQSVRHDVESYAEKKREEGEGPRGIFDNPDPAILLELEPYLRSLLLTADELPLSPRHEQAKRLLERARLKARSNHVGDDRPTRRSQSDHRSPLTKQPDESYDISTVQKVPQVKDYLPAQTTAGPLLVPDQRDTSPSDPASRSRRYGCSPTRVRFEDESEKEAESRYLDRMRQRGRPGYPKSKQKDSNTDSSSSGSERSRTNRSVSVPASQKLEDASSQVTTVIKEIIVVVKKCESCGSVVREPHTPPSGPDPQNMDPQTSGNQEDPRGKPVPRWVPPNKPEVSTRPKAPLTVTFAGAYILGEGKESSTGWKSSGFGKLRRRSRKGESRLESGNGPYGPSWAQRRNSNPRNRGSTSRAVSFAPDSPVTLEPRLPGASTRKRESPPSLPIKSALKSSSRNRTATIQSTPPFQKSTGQGAEGGQHSALLDSPEGSSQGTPAASNQLSCVRPSTLRYSPARLTTDVPTTEVWDATPDGAAGGDPGSGSEGRAALRGSALSRTDDLRAELLRAEHLKAEALWEESYDGSRKLDGRSKPFLRRFFSSIGLNSVGRLVKGGRSSSMEQLSLPAPPRAGSASPSPTRRPHPAIRIQRTPSLQTLNTVLPLAQLRKASSVQSLERRTERTTILGEVQIPYGLAPGLDSPQLELHRTLSVEEILTTRVVLPVGRVAQVFPDGSLLLELIRPPNGPFGFVISRGKGRPDTGVYVEKVGDGSGESPYVGLLGNGDEILQVNGEAVAGLSLEQVTWLMTRESIAILRIIPARRNQR